MLDMMILTAGTRQTYYDDFRTIIVVDVCRSDAKQVVESIFDATAMDIMTQTHFDHLVLDPVRIRKFK